MVKLRYFLLAKLMLIFLCVNCTKDEPIIEPTNEDYIIGEWNYYKSENITNGRIDTIDYVWKFKADKSFWAQLDDQPAKEGWYSIDNDSLSMSWVANDTITIYLLILDCDLKEMKLQNGNWICYFNKL